MTTARRPGRIQKIAYDATPLNASRPDIDARIGWLLAMSRLHHPDPEMSDGRRFVQAIATAGYRASRSLVSRWESGEIAVSYEAMSAYELALGMEPGRISSLTGYMRAAIPGVKARVIRPLLDPGAMEFSYRLDELIELVEEGEAGAADWQDLGWHLAAVPLAHLRAHTWETLCRRLVDVLPRSIKVPYRQYSTAAMNLASVPRAQEFLTEAVVQFVSTPGVQVLSDVVALLDQLPTRDAARLVLDLIDDPPADTVMELAVWVAAQKVQRGDFTAEERTRLDMAVLRQWRADPVKASEQLARLVASLPEGIRSTLAAAASKAGRQRLGYAVERGEEFGPSLTQSLSHDIAEAARSGVPQRPSYGEDRMLERLVREALFHIDSERRHLASLLVSASPFGNAVAAELLSLLATASLPPLVRGRMATMARYLSDEEHRLRMLNFIDDPSDEVGAMLVQAVGHMTLSDFSDQAIRGALGPELTPRERAKMYALGMTGSPGLALIARASTAPEWQRTAAAWWLSQGPAVRS